MADLTTLAAVKAYLGITNNAQDADLQAQISAASAAAEAYLGRPILRATYVETRDGNGASAMVTRRWPVRAVASVYVDGTQVPVSASVSADGYTFDDHRIVLRGCRLFTRTRLNVQISYEAGFDTVPADVSQAVIEMVALGVKRGTHIDVSSKALAGESITYITGEMTPSAKQALGSYRSVATP
jgi:uncharacterized phiE125 gp8 family phage protein